MLEELLKQLSEENQACDAKIQSLEAQKVEAQQEAATKIRVSELLIEVETTKKQALTAAAMKLKEEAKTAASAG